MISNFLSYKLSVAVLNDGIRVKDRQSLRKSLLLDLASPCHGHGKNLEKTKKGNRHFAEGVVFIKVGCMS